MTIHVPVLVIGGGPTGLCLASDLAWRGTRCLLVEKRREREIHPKATLLGPRSMELLRRWNIDEKIYASALPNDLVYRIFFVMGMNGPVLTRFESPSIDHFRHQKLEDATRWPELLWSPYGKTQIGQHAVEPVLLDVARGQANLDLREGWELVAFEQDADRVRATIRDAATGQEEVVEADYMIGCDGGASAVRRALGIRFVGRGPMRANVTFFFRSPEFAKAHPVGAGNLFYNMLPDTFGVFMSIDGKDLWGYQFYFLDPKKKTDDPDVAGILHRAVGRPFEFELLNITHWHHHQSVVTHFREGRVFLAGDAAHLFSPTGGVGMNTGIVDAFDLSWKLDAVAKGWGGPWLLDSYEEERRPIAIMNTQWAASNSDKIDMIMAEVSADYLEDTPRAELLRAQLSRKVTWTVSQYNSTGVHLGYRYSRSSICCPDGEIEPPSCSRFVTTSTFPGFRAPHVWMADGRSTIDLFGKDFVLVCARDATAAEAGPLVSAFAAQGVPLQVAEIRETAVDTAYERRFVLVRPDGHVAWRGEAMPADPEAIVARVRGDERPAFVPEWAGPDDVAALRRGSKESARHDQ